NEENNLLHPLRQVRERVRLEQRRLRAQAREAEHRQPRVRRLGLEHELLRVRVAAELEGIQAEVARRSSTTLGRLHDGNHRRQLGHRRKQQHDAHVARREHGVVGVERVDARVLLAREVDARVDREPADDREHADAAVLELGLAHPVDHGDLGVLAHPPLLGDDHLRHVPVAVGEPQRVEADVARVVQTVERGGALEEGHGRRLRVQRRRRRDLRDRRDERAGRGRQGDDDLHLTTCARGGDCASAVCGSLLSCGWPWCRQRSAAGRRRTSVVLSSPTGVPLVYRCPGELYFAYSWSAIAPISARAAARPLVR
ncbi:unnamed protein product, partial [Pelagomonas calceolata]